MGWILKYMTDKELKRLNKFDSRIQEICRDFGLDFFDQEFDIVSSQKMIEIMSYGFPVNYSHWSFGRELDRERTLYEHGSPIPYECVLNSDPSRAYLMNTNPLPVQVMVMSHVYAHNNFMRSNVHFKPTRKDILPSTSEAASRFREYEKRFGIQDVEKLLDAGLSIDLNTNPDFFILEESEEEQKTRLTTYQPSEEIFDKYNDLISRKKLSTFPKNYYDKKTPLEPDRDVLLYVLNHSPKPLKEWEKDVLSVLRNQSRYFMPQRRTKIMNEGWATFWHMRIMNRLFREGLLSTDEHGYYNLYNSRVLATHSRVMNPYLVGLRTFEDIEDRWNKGKFGKDWDECKDPKKHESWNLKLNKGKEKLFEVSRCYSDRFFIEHFLTEKLVNDLNLYIYAGQQDQAETKYVITEKDWKRIKNLLVTYLSTFYTPLIMVENGDYKGKRELFLKHYYDGIELEEEYRKRTLEYVFYLWDRPVHLETVVDNEQTIFTYDGSKQEKFQFK